MEKQKYQAYATATQTVARTRQIVMLYDGAIRFLRQAKEAISQNRIEDRYNTLVKANDIIMGLQSCLDFENGGDMAKVLYGYYAGVIDRIFLLHRSADPEACEEIIADLKQMRDVWDGIDRAGGASSSDSAVPQAAPAAAPASDTNKDSKDPPPASVTLSA